MGITFITGIDTDIGKTYATGLLARFLRMKGESVITQKIVQTGSSGRSEDILIHRRIMGSEYTEDDEMRTTCPYLFEFPASPHLAAGLAHEHIDPAFITAATEKLALKYRHVLVEGVGGICVPLNSQATLLDYLAERHYPIILVSSSRLGSINHTLMSLEILKYKKLFVRGIIYNRFQGENTEIADDTKNVFKKYLNKSVYPSVVIDMPRIDLSAIPDIDFAPLFP
jgi:dethiobiotin synthetase